MKLAALIDEFGLLQDRVKLFNPTTTRLEALKKELETRFEKDPADRAIEKSGDSYVLQASPRKNERKIKSIVQIFQALKKDKFLALCGFTLTALESACQELKLDLGRFVSESRTGRRTFTAIRKLEPVAERAKAA